MVSILVRKFNAYYANRPVLTTMITNAVLGGIADTVAQTLTAVRVRQKQTQAYGSDDSSRDDLLSIGLHELDKKSTLAGPGRLSHSSVEAWPSAV